MTSKVETREQDRAAIQATAGGVDMPVCQPAVGRAERTGMSVPILCKRGI